jgi:hypothetical protein
MQRRDRLRGRNIGNLVNEIGTLARGTGQSSNARDAEEYGRRSFSFSFSLSVLLFPSPPPPPSLFLFPFPPFPLKFPSGVPAHESGDSYEGEEKREGEADRQAGKQGRMRWKTGRCLVYPCRRDVPLLCTSIP